MRHCWTTGTGANVGSYMRTLLDFLIGYYFLVRGELRRMAEPADMFVMHLLTEGTSRLVFDKRYLGALRNWDFRICPIGALAMYLFTHFHVRGAWPNLCSPKDWDGIKLLRGSGREHELNDKIHRTWSEM